MSYWIKMAARTLSQLTPPSKKLQHGMNKSLVVVAKKTKEVLHKMAAGLCTVYCLKETILAHAHSMISIKPACGDEATSIHIKKVGVIPGLETEYPSQMFLPLLSH